MGSSSLGVNWDDSLQQSPNCINLVGMKIRCEMTPPSFASRRRGVPRGVCKWMWVSGGGSVRWIHWGLLEIPPRLITLLGSFLQHRTSWTNMAKSHQEGRVLKNWGIWVEASQQSSTDPSQGVAFQALMVSLGLRSLLAQWPSLIAGPYKGTHQLQEWFLLLQGLVGKVR